MKFLPLALLVLGSAVLAESAWTDEPLRTWRDNTGDFQVEARLIAISDDESSVSIQLADQQLVDVPLSRLSSRDRRYVLQTQRSMAQQSSLKRERGSRPDSNTTKLLGIDWHRTSESAAQAAGRGTEKPIMCFRVLGDLTGYM